MPPNDLRILLDLIDATKQLKLGLSALAERSESHEAQIYVDNADALLAGISAQALEAQRRQAYLTDFAADPPRIHIGDSDK